MPSHVPRTPGAAMKLKLGALVNRVQQIRVPQIGLGQASSARRGFWDWSW
jgi:hypothetical protein